MTGEKIIVLFATSLCVLIVVTVAAAQYSSVHTYHTVPVLPHIVAARPGESQPTATTTPAPMLATSTLWFAGDVMLARQVGDLAKIRGYQSPFSGIQSFFISTTTLPQYTFINFEGCLSPTSVFDYTQPLRFIVASSAIPILPLVGITHASLANNHALDCGQTGYLHTKNILLGAEVVPFGHPNKISSTSVAYIDTSERRVAVVGIHILDGLPATEELEALLSTLASTSDYQIVYIHWGNEYETTASRTQRSFARTLSSLGVDIIVGHHPHVVQDIEYIGNTLVVYSLGNLIFDQYFSKAVQQGLLLQLQIGETVLAELVPVTSEYSHTQPHAMVGDERETFLHNLATRSDETLQNSIVRGYFSLP